MTIANSQSRRLLKGAKAIGGHIDKSAHEVNHLLRQGRIPCAFKIGDLWHARPEALDAWIDDLERQAIAAAKAGAIGSGANGSTNAGAPE